MNKNISDILLNEFSQYLENHLGLYYPPEKWIDLERGIIPAAKAFHFKDPISFISWILSEPVSSDILEEISRHFTIGETYFLRETPSVEALERYILPTLFESRRVTKRIRIWSASCSTGEEPYSIAILIDKLLPDSRDWDITILASDINPDALAKLKKGEYSEWSFRGVTPEIKHKYFTKVAAHNRYEIINRIKKKVKAFSLNLVEDLFPSLVNNTNDMDLILCRNTLMYFSSEQSHRVLTKLSQALVNDGYLMVGASENSLVQVKGLKALNMMGTIIHQKQDKKWEHKPEPIYPQYPETIIQPDLLLMKQDVSEKIMDLFQDENIPKETDPAESSVPSSTESSRIPRATTSTPDYSIENISDSIANTANFKESLDILDNAISQDKCNENLRYLKALILLELGSLPEAEAELQKAIYLNPNYILPYFSLGNIAYQKGNKKDAKKYFSIVLSLIKNITPKDIIPGSEGLTAERIQEIIHSTKLF